MKYLKQILLIFSVSIFISCAGIYEDGSDVASVVKKDITEISVEDLKTKIDNEEEFYLIDVRQESEYDVASIPGAFNIPRGQLEFLIIDEAYWEEQFFYYPEKDNEIIIYCKLGSRGTLATLALQQLGFTNVKNLHGGIVAFDPELVDSSKQPKESSGCGG